jgi:Uma2 family endonuclease
LAERRHEIVAGQIHVMAGATNEHDAVVSSAIVSLGPYLRGRPCRVCTADTKARVVSGSYTSFYCPDAMAVCQPNPPHEVYQDRLVVIVEVMSPSTQRIDRNEKRDAYFAIPTLSAYVLLDTTGAPALVYQRDASGTFREAHHVGLDATIPVPAIDCELKLRDAYERVVAFERMPTDPSELPPR